MTASDLIKELQELIELCGDQEVFVVMRESSNDNMDADVTSTYYDEDANRIVLSDDIWWG